MATSTDRAGDELPPFAAGRRPGAPTTVRANGIEIGCWRAGSGPAVIFLHGLGWDGALWWPLVARYLDRFDVICPDTRGHGLSTKAPGPYSIDLFADDLLALMDALGVRRAALVGLSQGGMTAQMVAVRAPERITALAALATAARSDPATTTEMEQRIAAQRAAGPEAAARTAARSVFSEPFRARHAPYVERFVAWRAAMDANALEAAIRALAAYDVEDRLRRLTVPTLVVAGADDALIPPAATRRIAELVPDAAHVEVAGSGHMIAVEQPEALAAALDPFLEEHR